MLEILKYNRNVRVISAANFINRLGDSVESRDTIRANTRHVGENGVKVVVEKNERYAL